jgi:hypothetical protein
VVALSRVLASMGNVPEAMEIKRPVQDKKLSPALTLGVPGEWCRFSRLWLDRARYSLRNRNKSYYFLLNVGRWLGKVHPKGYVACRLDQGTHCGSGGRRVPVARRRLVQHRSDSCEEPRSDPRAQHTRGPHFHSSRVLREFFA